MAYPTAVNSQITDDVVNPQITDATAVNPQITDAIDIANLKAIGEQPAMLSNLAFSNLVNNVNLAQQNAVANQQAMNQLGVSVLGKAVNLITTLGPLEAASATHVLTGNTVAQDIADLKAAVQAFSPAGAGNSKS
jgi:Killing trait